MKGIKPADQGAGLLTVLFPMPDPENVQMLRCNFIANNIFAEYQFTNFTREVGYRSTDLRPFLQPFYGTTKSLGYLSGNLRAMLRDKLSEPY